MIMVIHDAFSPPGDWNGFRTGQGTVLDTHQYQVFEGQHLGRDINGHVAQACGIGRMLKPIDKPVVVAEFSGAMSMIHLHVASFAICY